MAGPSTSKERHTNAERTVLCPVEGCGAEKLARGVHLHVRMSDGDGHGPRGDIPPQLDFENLEEAGTQEVEMNYPEHRETEQVARLCPYCERPFRGKHGVLIHLGQVRGKHSHPEDLPDDLDPNEFPLVHVDDEGIVETVEAGGVLPSTERREDLPERVATYIERLEDEGKHEEAVRARQMLS